MDKFDNKQELEEMFQRIKKYIKENPKKTRLKQISDALQIPIKKILDFVYDERLMFVFKEDDQEIINLLKKEDEHRRELLEVFRKEDNDFKEKLRKRAYEYNSNSKLVKDLNNRDINKIYNTKSNNIENRSEK